MTSEAEAARKPTVRWYNNAAVRSVIFQIALLAVVVAVGVLAVWNAATNLQQAGRASGFGFFWQVAGFDISQRPIEYSATSTYGRAFFVGLLNTLIVSGLGIVLATLLGFAIGIGRLSSNWVIARIATGYVELIRNIPLLLQLLFWYGAVLKPLPNPRESVTLFNSIFLNNRGLYFPAFELLGPAFLFPLAIIIGLLGSVLFAAWARRRQMATGKRPPVLLVSLALILGLPILSFFAGHMKLTVSFAELRGFNLIGGFVIAPEFAALLFGLSTYTAAFIAEVIRAGILGVSKGQSEAAYAMGLRRGFALRLVVVPQALRIIIPPLTNQYLNLTKNSSLAVFIGYPDLVQIFTGTVLNQTNQAIECVAITMAVYLVISLVISGGMNWYNKRVALVER